MPSKYNASQVLLDTIEQCPPQVKRCLEPLSVPHLRFVIVYCGEARGNGELAVKLAGYRCKPTSRAMMASGLLRRPDVRAAVQAWMEAFAMTGAEVTWRIADLANCNPGPFFEPDPTTKRLKLKQKIEPEDWARFKHWVKSIQADKDGNVIGMELHDAHAANRDLAKITKLFSDAPIFNLNMHFSNLSNEELLAELEEVRMQEIEAPPQPLLPPGNIAP